MELNINGRKLWLHGILDSEHHKSMMRFDLCITSSLTVFAMGCFAMYDLFWGVWGGAMWICIFLPQIMWYWFEYGRQYQKYVLSLELERMSEIAKKLEE